MYNVETLIQHRDNKKNKIQSRRFAEKKRTKKIGIYIIALLSFSFLVFVLSSMSSASFLHINTIEIIGAAQDIASTTRSIAETSMQGNYLGIFSRSNIFLYPKSDIENTIKGKFLSTEDVFIKRNGLNSIQINIVSKIPTSILCTSIPDDFKSLQSDNCFFSDKNGYIFSKINAYTGSLPVILIQDSTSSEMIGTVTLDRDRYNKLLKFYKKVVDSGLIVRGLLVSDSHDELYVDNHNTLDASDIVVIYFSEKNDIDDTLLNLVSFWDHMKSDKVTHNFSEIKLQFPPNVYYTEIK